jgi:hypothetical protein
MDDRLPKDVSISWHARHARTRERIVNEAVGTPINRRRERMLTVMGRV